MTVSSDILREIGAPDRLETSLGVLEFRDGVPSGGTAEKLYDHLDFVHAVNAYLDGFAAASTYAIRKGFHDAGAADNSIIIFSQLMGSESVFLTANADTVYYVGVVDMSSGPMVVETPPQALGVFDDMWWRLDHRLRPAGSGSRRRRTLPARPAGYDGILPDSGYHIGHSRTSRALLLGRSFLTHDDPAPTVATIKSTLKVYPYAPGATAPASRRCSGAAPRPLRLPHRDGLRRGQRACVQHRSAERLRVLRADERGRPGRARRQHQPRAPGAAGRDRDRQGRAVRARRPHAAHPRRCGGCRKRDLASAVLQLPGR